MRRHFSIWVLACLLLLPLEVPAINVDGLYVVEVPIAGQDSDEREQGIRAAFSDLLVRITGSRDTLYRNAAVTLLEQASQYVQRYQYGKAAATPEGEAQPILEVRFDAEAVDQALWKSGLPVWGRARPATLVWIAVQDGDSRRLLDANTPSSFLTALQERAHDRGLPLVFPLLDLEDRFKVSVSDVWANFNESIQEASKRYETEAILVGRVFQDVMGGWQGRWTLYEGNSSSQWTSQGEALAPVVGEAVDGAADQLAARYANDGGVDSQGVVFMSVSDVAGVDDYARASRYLASLSPVQKIQVSSVEPARVIYRLELRGGRDGLEKAITLGNTFVVDAVNPPQPGSPLSLAYRLLP